MAKGFKQAGLRQVFVVWIRRVLLLSRALNRELPEFKDLQDLPEVHDMLSEQIKKWPEQWEERGRQEGRQEAVLCALEEKREILHRLLSFGGSVMSRSRRRLA